MLLRAYRAILTHAFTGLKSPGGVVAATVCAGLIGFGSNAAATQEIELSVKDFNTLVDGQQKNQDFTFSDLVNWGNSANPKLDFSGASAIHIIGYKEGYDKSYVLNYLGKKVKSAGTSTTGSFKFENTYNAPDLIFTNYTISNAGICLDEGNKTKFNSISIFEGAGNSFTAGIDFTKWDASDKTHKGGNYTQGVIHIAEPSEKSKDSELYGIIRVTKFKDITLYNKLDNFTDYTSDQYGGFGILITDKQDTKDDSALVDVFTDQANSGISKQTSSQAQTQDTSLDKVSEQSKNFAAASNVVLQADNSILIDTVFDEAIKIQRNHMAYLQAGSGGITLKTDLDQDSSAVGFNGGEEPAGQGFTDFGKHKAVSVNFGSRLKMEAVDGGDIRVAGQVEIGFNSTFSIKIDTDEPKNGDTPYKGYNTQALFSASNNYINAQWSDYQLIEKQENQYKVADGALSVNNKATFTMEASGSNIIQARDFSALYASNFKAANDADATGKLSDPAVNTTTTIVNLTGQNNELYAFGSGVSSYAAEGAQHPENIGLQAVSLPGKDTQKAAEAVQPVQVNLHATSQNIVHGSDQGILASGNGVEVNLAGSGSALSQINEVTGGSTAINAQNGAVVHLSGVKNTIQIGQSAAGRSFLNTEQDKSPTTAIVASGQGSKVLVEGAGNISIRNAASGKAVLAEEGAEKDEHILDLGRLKQADRQIGAYAARVIDGASLELSKHSTSEHQAGRRSVQAETSGTNAVIESSELGVLVRNASFTSELDNNVIIAEELSGYEESNETFQGWTQLLQDDQSESGYQYSDKVAETNKTLLGNLNQLSSRNFVRLGDHIAVASVLENTDSPVAYAAESTGQTGTTSQVSLQAAVSNILAGAVVAISDPAAENTQMLDGAEHDPANKVTITARSGDNFILSSVKVDTKSFLEGKSQTAAEGEPSTDPEKYKFHTAVFAAGADSVVNISAEQGWNYILTDSRKDREQVLRATEGATINISGNTFISANANYGADGFIPANNSEGVALAAGMDVREDSQQTSYIKLNAEPIAGAEDGKSFDGKASYIFGDVAAGRNGSITISHPQNTAATFIRGNVLAANGGKVELNLGDNGVWIGRGDDYGDAGNGNTQTSHGNGSNPSQDDFFNPVFSNSIASAGTVDVTMGENSCWYLTGQSWIASLKATGAARIYLSSLGAENRSHALLIRKLKAGDGKATFYISLDHQRHEISDMFYIKEIEKAATYNLNIINQIADLESVSVDNPLRLATIRRSADGSFDNPFTEYADYRDHGVANNKLKLEVVKHNYDGKNDNYNGTDMTQSKPGSSVLEGFFKDDADAGNSGSGESSSAGGDNKPSEDPAENKVPSGLAATKPQEPAAYDSDVAGLDAVRPEDNDELYDIVIVDAPGLNGGGNGGGNSGNGGGNSGSAGNSGGHTPGGDPIVEVSDAGKTIFNMARANYAMAVYLDTLNKRQGESRFTGPEDNGIWVRVRYDDIGRSDNAYDLDRIMTEVGYDLRHESPNGDTWHYGLAGHYMDGDLKYDQVDGKGDLSSYGAWLYATYQDKEKDNYVDLILKYERIKNDFEFSSKSIGERITGGYHNHVLSASVETGRKFTYTQGWFFEPQVQLQYAYISGADYSTSQGSKVDMKSVDSLIGRLGMRLGRDFTVNEHKLSCYVRGDAMHEFLGEQKVRAYDATADLSYSLKNEGTWYATGLGISAQTSDSSYLFFEGERLWGNGYEDSYSVSAGFRYTF